MSVQDVSVVGVLSSEHALKCAGNPVEGVPVTYNTWPFFTLLSTSRSDFWLLTALLMLSSGPAYGKWMQVLQNDEVGVTIYVDSDLIGRNGNRVKVWELIDYDRIQTEAGTPYLSARLQREYDCANELQRTLAITKLSGNMGAGEVVFTDQDAHKWEPVDPGTIGKRLWKVACGKQ